jgi:hypothetical protein
VNHVRLPNLANGAPHTVQLPDSGLVGNGDTPHTEGASLVVIYRLLPAGAAPYKAVVIYDGASTMTKSSSAFMQTIGGFYQALGSGADLSSFRSHTQGKMTQIVGNGQPGFSATLTVSTPTVNGAVPAGVGGTPFVGAEGSRWDNLTFNINLNPNDNLLETQVLGGGNQVCLSWDAVVTSTNVVNSDGDGLLDVWKTTKGLMDPNGQTLPDLADMGAKKGQKDVFIQIDWMHGSDGHLHIPKLAALRQVASVFSQHGITLHFDVGNNYQQNQPLLFIVPAAYAKGGQVIEESSLLCPNNQTRVCAFTEPYSVSGWKKGLEAIKNASPILGIPAHFAHARKDIFHYMLFGHTLAGPFDAKGNPLAANPSSVSGVADTPGGDVLVSLGLWRSDNPPGCDPTTTCTDQTGSALIQAGTMMHELGHNLGLHHGGSVRVPNCMPDYPSVMNYPYQTRGLTDALGFEHVEYSTGSLAGLNEGSLSEANSMGPLTYRVRYYAPANSFERGAGATAKAHCDGTHLNPGESSVRLETPGLGTPDWDNNDGNGVMDTDSATIFKEDINFNGTTADAVKDSVVPGQGFIDHNDWSTLNLQQIGARLNVAGLSADVGQTDLGQTDPGQTDLGQTDLGQADLGDVDYDTAIYTLDATGSTTPLVATVSATVPANGYNQISLTWGPPSRGQIRTYNIFRTNLDAVSPTAMFVKSVANTPPLITYNDAISDMSASDSGATCPATSVCYNTNYQYFITAVDVNGTTSVPSNFATGIVKHLFVTANSKTLVYGVAPVLDSTITGMDQPAPFTPSCTNTTGAVPPRNVGTYTIQCTGPSAVGTGGVDGVTYAVGTLTITPHPLAITAQPNTKVFDGTTRAAAIPVVSCLVYNDTVIGRAEQYTSVGPGSGLRLVVSAYTVMDGKSGKNYTVTTIPSMNGVINAVPEE